MIRLVNKSRIVLAVAVFLAAGVLVTGCSSKSAAEGEKGEKIIVGTGNAMKPYCYLDENGTLAGYEIEVLSAIDELLPQYEFEFQQFDFPNILVSLDAKKIDLGAHQFELNEERQAKYLFGEESYTTFILRITVDKERNDIEGLEDLQGKNVKVSTGSNDAYILEQYNKENPENPINLVYSSETTEQLLNNIENGTYDAFISIRRVVESYNKEFGDRLKTVGEPIASSSTYYVYNKESEQLKKEIDGALKELKESGKLAELSIATLGGDYTTND